MSDEKLDEGVEIVLCEKPLDPEGYDDDLKDDPACGYGEDCESCPEGDCDCKEV
jgi:hypothetical protein